VEIHAARRLRTYETPRETGNANPLSAALLQTSNWQFQFAVLAIPMNDSVKTANSYQKQRSGPEPTRTSCLSYNPAGDNDNREEEKHAEL
jgi:hypothetical protein